MNVSDELVAAVARALREETDKFASPVQCYVEGEAQRRAFPDGPPPTDDDAAWERYESFTPQDDWAILARAALAAIPSRTQSEAE